MTSDEPDFCAILHAGVAPERMPGLLELVDAANSAQNYDELFSLSVGFFEQIGAGAVNCAMFDNQGFEFVGFSSSMRQAALAQYDQEDLAESDPLVSRIAECAGPAILGWGYGVTEPWRRGNAHRILANMEQDGYYGLFFQPVKLSGTAYSAAITIATELPPDEAHAYLLANGSLMMLASNAIGIRATQVFHIRGTDDSWRPTRSAPLTVREHEVVSWLSKGERPEQIAHRMNIKPVTVHMHVASARQKLGARTREQLVTTALQKGLV